ncbi:MAG: sulfite exporter TauE/SafE family protein [Phycisphaerales bacterium]|nr:sulfite exporter TauE/SafE family protein [Phycisphaerales bacterium]
MSLEEFLCAFPIGLVGGVFGGMLGIGGSVISIPLLDLVHGPNQQLYQASSMVANVCVAISASLKHRGRGTIRADLVTTMLPLAGAGAIAGVLMSNQIDSAPLRGVFGGFLVLTALLELRSVLAKQGSASTEDDGTLRGTRVSCGAIALVGGIASGLLGVGGGVLMVPLMRGLVGMPLRQAIATASVVMLASTSVGAIAKNATISSLHNSVGIPLTLERSMSLALPLAIAALIGAAIGASISYRLPLRVLKLVFTALITLAGTRMLLQALQESGMTS